MRPITTTFNDSLQLDQTNRHYAALNHYTTKYCREKLKQSNNESKSRNLIIIKYKNNHHQTIIRKLIKLITSNKFFFLFIRTNRNKERILQKSFEQI